MPIWLRTAALKTTTAGPSQRLYDAGRFPSGEAQSSGSSGAHGAPLMWLPPSTKRVLPVR